MKVYFENQKTLCIESEGYAENLALESWTKRYTPFFLHVLYLNNSISFSPPEDETYLVIRNFTDEQK